MIDVLVADITTLAVDAIVNAANSALRGGGGVDGAIHRAAGPELMAALRRYPGCATGDAVLTRGYHLPARYVIHAVGPVWTDGARGEPELLAGAYRASFRLAAAQGDVRTIAFPAISTGVYGYPRPAAAAIAAREMVAHEPGFDRIVAAVTDADTAALYTRALAAARAGASPA
jgi:O-acetyl-ADP-ribose deacetylase (regulator of RNase III)